MVCKKDFFALGYEISQKKQQLEELAINKATREQYIQVFFLQKKIKKITEDYNLAIKIRKLSQHSYEQGQISLIGVKRAKIEEKRLKVKLVHQNRIFDLKLEQFKRALGFARGDQVKLKTKINFRKNFSSLDKSSLQSYSHKSSRSVLLINQLSYNKSLAGSRSKSFFYLPELSLSASYDLEKRTSYQFNVSWNLFNRRMDYSTFQLALFEKEKEDMLFHKSKRDYLDDSDKFISELLNLKQNYNLQKSIEGDLKEILSFSKDGFFKGMVKAQDLNHDLKSYLIQQEALLDTEKELLLKISNYASFLGKDEIFYELVVISE